MEDVEGLGGLGETLVGGIGIGVVQGGVIGEGELAVAAWDGFYCEQICWRVAVRGTPRIL